MNKYKDKKAVVIGGTIGIGLATVKVLLEGSAETSSRPCGSPAKLMNRGYAPLERSG